MARIIAQYVHVQNPETMLMEVLVPGTEAPAWVTDEVISNPAVFVTELEPELEPEPEPEAKKPASKK